MIKQYKSDFYNHPIEVDNIWWELIVTITDNKWRKIIYSWYDLVSKNTQSHYINKCILWWLIKQTPKNILIIWFWWWAFCKYLEDHISNIKITWIDIDETMFKIAKEEFKVKTNDFITMDAKEAINKLVLEDKKYDLILIDVYWNNWNIPESFKEKSTYENIKKILESNGTLSINYADYRWINIWKYNKIHFFLKELFGENYIHILSEKETKWNVSWIYNLDKKYNSIDINLKYLEKVKKAEILYDSNMIKNIIIEN